MPLAAFLTPTAEAPPETTAPVPTESLVPEDLETTLRAARRFRAALSDALDAALPELLRAIAEEVLARELRLEPAAIARVVATALERAGEEHVVAIRIHPGEREALAPLGLITVSDPSLARGDCRVELRSGTIDASLRSRLETVIVALAS